MNEDKHIPQGYKDSPLGIIPKEWEVKRLGDVCYISVGRDVQVDHFSEFMTDDYKYPVYSNTIEEKGLYGFYNYEEFTKGKVTVVGRGVGLGTSFARDNGFGAIGRLVVLTPRNNLSNHYLENYINSKVHFFVESAAIPQLTGEQIASYKIAIPPFPEQLLIENYIQLWDTAIEKQSELVEKLKLRKRALMQQLLTGKKRLPGCCGEWKEVKLGDVFDERNETNRDDLPLLSITGDKGVIYQTDSDKRDISNDDKSKYKRIYPNDIGYNTMRMWQGRSALSELEGIVSPAYTIVTPREGVNVKFMSMLIQQPRVVYDFWTHSQGLVSDTLNCKYPDFCQVKVRIPTEEEQTAIASVLVKADKEIELAKEKLLNLQSQKRGLMQQLLTGKKRVV